MGKTKNLIFYSLIRVTESGTWAHEPPHLSRLTVILQPTALIHTQLIELQFREYIFTSWLALSIGLTNLAKPYHVHYHLSQPDMAGQNGATRRAPASVQRFCWLMSVGTRLVLFLIILNSMICWFVQTRSNTWQLTWSMHNLAGESIFRKTGIIDQLYCELYLFGLSDCMYFTLCLVTFELKQQTQCIDCQRAQRHWLGHFNT